MTLINQPSPSVPAFAMPPRPAPPRTRINKVTSSYAGLLKTVRDAGMLQRCQRYYLVLLTILVVIGTGICVVFFLLGDSWFQLAVAGASGVVFTQFAFLGHEAAHQQVFASRSANDWTARLIATLVVGMSYALD